MTEIFASFLTVAQQIFILFLLVAVGFILGKTGLIDQNGSVVMSSVVMYAVTPAILVGESMVCRRAGGRCDSRGLSCDPEQFSIFFRTSQA